MSSQSLQIGDGSSNPSFVQQGQVDWVAFANSTISSSISVLQRFSAAGVQPVTVAGVLALGSRFELGRKGEQNMNAALKGLNGAFGFDKLLYYGFGYRSFVNVLTDTRAGVNLVALCSCLVDMYGISFAAEILVALWRREEFPEHFEPSMSQFNALATACGGVVSSTVFGEVGGMMLGDLKDRLERTRSGFLGRSISRPEDVANALHGLFQISRGVHKQIEVMGGPNCAFIGAFAFWLLDLTLHIEDDKGKVIYLNAVDRETARVRIRYCSMAELSRSLAVISRTYVLRDHESMFVDSYQNEEVSFSVRTPWDGCLNRVFWSATQRLIGVSRTLGDFLGSAARVYAALARGEAEVGNFLREHYEGFVDGMHGRGFVESVGKIFPELNNVKGLHSAMLKALDNSFDKALTNLHAAVDTLIRLCGCECCESLANGIPLAGEGKGLDRHCLLSMAMTINSLVRLVAGLEMHDTISPTIAGLQQIHYLCQGRIEAGAGFNQGVTPLYAILDLASSDDPSPGRADYSKDHMGGVQCLFTGCFPTISGEGDVTGRLAFSFNGICCYIEALHGLNCNATTLGRIHVLPGRIQRGDREYREVRNLMPLAPESPLPEAKLSPNNLNVPSKFRDDKVEIKGIVHEVTGRSAIGFCYEAVSDGMRIRIYPSYTRDVLRRVGLITCDRQTCKKQLAIPCNIVQEGWALPIGEREPEDCSGCYVWPFRENDVCRCMALVAVWLATTGQMRRHLDQKIYYRNGECLPCCTKAVFNEQFSIII